MKLDQPAMPCELAERQEDGSLEYKRYPGFTKRELAAIHLCVPMSGNDELDSMIRRAQRERLAGQILQGIITGNHADPIVTGEPGIKSVVRDAYRVADAVIAAGEVKP
jgi:hypothetical protein